MKTTQHSETGKLTYKRITNFYSNLFAVLGAVVIFILFIITISVVLYIAKRGNIISMLR